METYKTWPEMLKKTNYANKPTYFGKEIYPNTGSVKIDWKILSNAISMLNHTDDIEEYFYFLEFSKHLVEGFDFEYFKHFLPEIYQLNFVQTNNFDVKGNLGSIVAGYHLIIPKQHILSMSSLDDQQRTEYISLLKTMRQTYKEIWGRAPIVFEHGTNNEEKPKASSITHAHTHIVNHQYTDEQKVIEYLGMQEVSSIEELLEIGREKNYISYISPEERYFIAEPRQEESQIMRKFIAEDIGVPNEWDWKEHSYLENTLETIKQFVLHNKKGAK